MKSARILTKAATPLTPQQVTNFVIAMSEGLYNLQLVIYGFCYEPGIGIYTIGPREQLEKMASNKNDIEDFNIEEYLNNIEPPTRFFHMNYMHPKGPTLEEMVKK